MLKVGPILVLTSSTLVLRQKQMSPHYGIAFYILQVLLIFSLSTQMMNILIMMIKTNLIIFSIQMTIQRKSEVVEETMMTTIYQREL